MVTDSQIVLEEPKMGRLLGLMIMALVLIVACGGEGETRTTTVSVLPSLSHDLVAQQVDIDPRIVTVNKPVLITFRVVNQGNQAGVPVKYSYTEQAGGSGVFPPVVPEDYCHTTTKLDPGEFCTSAYLFTFKAPGEKNLEVEIGLGHQILPPFDDSFILKIKLEVLPKQ